MSGYMVQHMCGGQGAAYKSWFSLSMWVHGLSGLAAGAPFPLRLFAGPTSYFFDMFL